MPPHEHSSEHAMPSRTSQSLPIRSNMLNSYCLAPEELRRQKDEVERKKAKAKRRSRKAAAAAASSSGDQLVTAVEGSRPETTSALQTSVPVPKTPIAFLFPGQGSQALGMLKVSTLVASHLRQQRGTRGDVGHEGYLLWPMLSADCDAGGKCLLWHYSQIAINFSVAVTSPSVNG